MQRNPRGYRLERARDPSVRHRARKREDCIVAGPRYPSLASVERRRKRSRAIEKTSDELEQEQEELRLALEKT